MTFEEALGVLEVAGPTDAVALRRAYLRLLRHHKPERDPEGFVRLREAYETAVAQVHWHHPWAPESAGATDLPEGEPSPVTIEPVRAAEAVTEDATDVTGTTSPMANDLGPTLATFDPLASLWERLDSLPADSFEERIAIAREMVAKEPSSSEARWRIVDELEAAGREEEAVEALRAAARAGLPHFQEELVARFPARLEAGEIDAVLASDDPSRLMGLGHALVSVARPDPGARAVMMALDVSLRRPELPSLRPWFVLDTLFALHEQNEVRRARDLQELFERWLREAGARLVDRDAACWAMLQELGKLGRAGTDAFPGEVRSAIAAALRQGVLENAEPRLRAFAESEPARARDAARLLVAHAPFLDRAIAGVLDPEFLAPNRPSRDTDFWEPNRSSSHRRRAGDWPRAGLVPVVIALLALLRVGARSCNDRPHADVHSDVARFEQIKQNLSALERVLDGGRSDGGLQAPGSQLVDLNAPMTTIGRAEASVRGLCRERPGASCVIARTALEDLREAPRCREASAQITALALAAPYDTDAGPARPDAGGALAIALRDLRGVWASICGGGP